MSQFSTDTLAAAHRFLLEINGCTDPDELRSRVPAGLSRLIACERASFNEVDHARAPQTVVPNPVPAWWARLGEVYQAHFMDHPLFSRTHVPALNQTVSLGDPCYAATWTKSALNHEYFLPLGVKNQLSAAIFRTDRAMAGIALNRGKTGFTRDDRALLDLLNPHVAQAWQNALSFSALRRKCGEAVDGALSVQAIVTVDGAGTRLRSLSASASQLMRKYFVVDSEGNARLPEQLDRWLQAQRLFLASPDAVASPLAQWVVRRPDGRLTVRLLCTKPEEAILLLDETNETVPVPKPGGSPPGLTQRESEILVWITEGKRSSEIAMILGISARTVEKHIEHLFMKLGVETRSAAIRHVFADRKSPYG